MRGAALGPPQPSSAVSVPESGIGRARERDRARDTEIDKKKVRVKDIKKEIRKKVRGKKERIDKYILISIYIIYIIYI